MRWIVWLYVADALPWLGCLLAYGLRYPWWATAWGRALVTTYTALSAVLVLAVTLRLVHMPYSLAIVLISITLGGVCVAGLVQLALILGAQRRR